MTLPPHRYWARRAAILALPEAQGRRAAALHYATLPNLSEAQVRFKLAGDPLDPAESPDATKDDEEWDRLVAQADAVRAAAAREANNWTPEVRAEADRQGGGSDGLASRVDGLGLSGAPRTAEGATETPEERLVRKARAMWGLEPQRRGG